jgi:hypothetical protein
MRPALLAALLFVLPSLAPAQVVFSEDFEAPAIANYLTVFDGDSLVTASNTWHVTQNSVDLYLAAARPEAGAYDGSQALDLTGSPDQGVMETEFATVPGAAYELVLHYARNNYLGLTPGVARVEILGSWVHLSAEIVHDPASLLFDQFVEFRGTFFADTPVTTLRLTSFNPGIAGITVDGITVTGAATTAANGGSVSWTGGPVLAARPNPSRGSVRIEYRLEQAGTVRASVFDVAGRRIGVLDPGVRPAGSHALEWNGKDANGARLPAGLYFLVLRTSEGASGRKLLLD